MITAKWKEGIGFYRNANAQIVAEEIMGIGESASPQQIVDKARNPDTELHKCFEWNDSIAAERFRLWQARDICCKLVIKEEVVPEDRPEVRVFVKTAAGENYKPTEIVVKHDGEYEQLLAQAWRELQIFKNKYKMLSELKEILDLIN